MLFYKILWNEAILKHINRKIYDFNTYFLYYTENGYLYYIKADSHDRIR